MKSEEFELVVDAQLKSCFNVLSVKAGEYATDKDRLHNFNVAADLQGISRRAALGGMMAKHIISIYDLLGAEETNPDKALWDEKITDSMNYLLLLQAMVTEEIAAGAKEPKPTFEDHLDEVAATINDSNLYDVGDLHRYEVVSEINGTKIAIVRDKVNDSTFVVKQYQIVFHPPYDPDRNDNRFLSKEN